MFRYTIPNKDIRTYLEGTYVKPINKFSVEVKPPTGEDDISSSYFASVKSNLEEWFKENNIEYILILTDTGNIFNNQWCFDFNKIDDLILFKLTWV